uniref:U9-Eretoxin-Ek1a_1 n=1 Tax=Eresus cinnaberinus TaxID=175337 RepID=A0A2D0PC51_ERECI
MKSSTAFILMAIFLLSLEYVKSSTFEDETLLDAGKEQARSCSATGPCVKNEDCCDGYICKCKIAGQNCRCGYTIMG